MRGMDDGPWTALGTLGWFLGVWLVMMAAMMFPSLAPTAALYARMTSGSAGAAAVHRRLPRGLGRRRRRSRSRSPAAGGAIAGDVLAWDRAGRWVAGATLLVAAAYELTPLKDVCLAKCRSPLGFLLGAWRDGRGGALQMGARHGAWCVGCCWALMASLFALGIMSIVWMAFVAALIAAEKSLPWRRVATYGTAGILLALGVAAARRARCRPGPDDPRRRADACDAADDVPLATVTQQPQAVERHEQRHAHVGGHGEHERDQPERGEHDEHAP